MNNFSESAITLGRIETEFNCLYGTKEMVQRLTQKERISELLRLCNRDSVSYHGFEYLEKKLILDNQ